MGLSNSKKLVELAKEGREKEAISLLNETYLIDPNYTNEDGDSCLHFSCSNDLKELTKYLLSYNVELNGKNIFGNCPLHIASRLGNDYIVGLLLKNIKCDINILTNNTLFNALTIASAHNNLNVAYLLLGQKLKCKVQDIALLYASMNKNGEEMTRLLLNHGANVNGTDENGNTPLMIACNLLNEKIVNVLISRQWKPNIEINKQNKFGWTALHFIYSNKNENIKKSNIIRLLLNKNANIELKNNKGIKPKDIMSISNKQKRKRNQQQQEYDDSYHDYYSPPKRQRRK